MNEDGDGERGRKEGEMEIKYGKRSCRMEVLRNERRKIGEEEGEEERKKRREERRSVGGRNLSGGKKQEIITPRACRG